MLLGAVAELLAIGTVLPFLSLLADPTLIANIPFLETLFALLGARSTSQILATATGIFIFTATAAGAIRLWLSWKSQMFVFRVGHDIAVEIQRKILNQPYTYHLVHNTSQTISAVEKVNVLVYNFLAQLMLAFTALTISIFIICALIYVDHFTAAISGLAFAVIYGLVTVFTKNRLARNSAATGAAYSQRVQMIQESLGGIRDIIIDNSQSIYLGGFKTIDRRFNDARANTVFIATAPRFVMEAAGMVVIAVLAVIIAGREGGIVQALPTLGALALGAQRLLPLTQQIYAGWASIAGNRQVLIDVLQLLQLIEPESARAKTGVSQLGFESKIEFVDVDYTYPGRERPALNGISLTIPKGSRVAVIGRTGSGKSTLIDLLMGLLEPSEGSLTIDGITLAGNARREWQKKIAHVPQAIFLADTTIERNIAFGSAVENIDRERIVAVARRAQLHDHIQSLPEGYETYVGERGVRLSGGQRQRLGIARALYKAAPVLILDEATSALDDDTETAVMRSLEESEAQNLTIIMIAHRLSTISKCDIVAQLDNGRIAEIGSYSEVMSLRRPESQSN